MIAFPQGQSVRAVAGRVSARTIAPRGIVGALTGMVMPDAPQRMM